MLCSSVCSAVALIRLAALSSLGLWELSSVRMEEPHCENQCGEEEIPRGPVAYLISSYDVSWVSRFVLKAVNTKKN